VSASPVAYSFVVPLLNEEEGLPELYRRLCEIMARLDGTAEIVLVDDGSSDGSLDVLRSFFKQDKRVVYLSLARNFGHQIAVSAGLRIARGGVAIVLDADLQDPPEIIPEMIVKWRQGYDIVYAQRVSREKERGPKRLFAYLFYRVLRRLSDVEIPVDAGDFCLLDRVVVDALNAMPERHRYVRGLRSWVGFRQTALKFERSARYAGRPKYTFWKSSALAIDGLLSFSRMPLRVATYFGLFSAAFSAITMMLIIYWRFFYPRSPLVGFAFIAMVVFFLGSVQLVGIGILGEYVGRIYEEVKRRPLYTVKEYGGGEPRVAAATPAE
jgi:polyisoprenyl-phosphate glycosyltransferase